MQFTPTCLWVFDSLSPAVFFLGLLISIQIHSCVFVPAYAHHRNMIEIRFYFLERDPYLFGQKDPYHK